MELDLDATIAALLLLRSLKGGQQKILIEDPVTKQHFPLVKIEQVDVTIVSENTEVDINVVVLKSLQEN